MNDRRFDLELESYVKGLEAVQPLLLHVCCAPCSSAVLEKLSAHFDVTVYYYNPNIESAAEYERRSEEVQRLLREMPLRGEPQAAGLPRQLFSSPVPRRFYRQSAFRSRGGL